MLAEKFYECFTKAIEAKRDVLESAWDNLGCFTNEIKQLISDAMKQTKETESFEVQREYYNIDLTGWVQRKTKSKEMLTVNDGIQAYKFEKYAWDFIMAIEHENDKNLWMDELIKLSYIFCELRVVIGYFPYIDNCTQKLMMQKKYLEEVAKTMQKLNCKDNLSNGEFMIILGDVCEKEDEGFKKLTYTPYLYNSSGKCFKLLNFEN